MFSVKCKKSVEEHVYICQSTESLKYCSSIVAAVY